MDESGRQHGRYWLWLREIVETIMIVLGFVWTALLILDFAYGLPSAGKSRLPGIAPRDSTTTPACRRGDIDFPGRCGRLYEDNVSPSRVFRICWS